MTQTLFDLLTTHRQKPDPCILRALQADPKDVPLYLDLEDAKELINASAYATKLCRPHLVSVTIRWDLMPGFSLREWMTHQIIMQERMRKWLVRHKVTIAFIWTREMGQSNGPHTHYLLHLPSDHWREFEQFMVTAGKFVDGDATGKAILLSGNEYGTKTPRMRAGHLLYLLKSLDPDAVCRAPTTAGGTRPLMPALGVDDRGEARLPIVGKRCGTSQTIGAKARKDAGWRELRTIAELRAALHP